MHWLYQGNGDLCAHGNIEFRIGDKLLVSPQDGDFAVSATALFLLRTLQKDHTKESPLCDQLLPHCGNAMYPAGKEDVLIPGCPFGNDFEVLNREDAFIIRDNKGMEYTTSSVEWVKAVCSFSDEVSAFYDQSLPRKPCDKIAEEGFSAFMREWKRRRGKVGI